MMAAGSAPAPGGDGPSAFPPPLFGHTGFSVGPALPASIVDDLRAIADDIPVPTDAAFFASANDCAPEVTAHVHDAITTCLRDVQRERFPGTSCILASVIAKGPGAASQVAFHQDLTYTDERHHRTCIVWIPLLDVDEQNGALWVVPGSHRWTWGPRAASDTLPTAAHQDAFLRRARCVPMGAGEVLAYDAALVHGSHNNGSTGMRTAIAMALVPEGAPLVHCVGRGRDNEIGAYAIESGYYLEQSLWAVPAGFPEVALWGEPVTTRDFLPGLEAVGGS